MFLESHSMDVLVNGDVVVSGHYLTDGRMALFSSPSFAGTIPPGPG